MFIEKTLGQLCELGKGKIQTGPFGSQLHQADYSEEGTPVVMPADIVDGKISKAKIARVSEDHVMRLDRHQLAIGDIVYGRRGDIGRQALVTSKEEGWLCGTGCLRVTVGKKSLIDPEYLHLYLKMPDVISYIQNQAIGATMPNLNTEILKRIPIRYPEKIADQKKVIAVLKAYFDLIENNKKRIQILENIAEELYKEWFVRFRFPNYEKTEFEKGLPSSWDRTQLKYLCFEVKQSIKKEDLNAHTKYLGLEHLSRKDIAIYDYSSADTVDSNKLKFKKFDILFAKIRPYLHKVCLAHFDGICSSDTIVLRAKDPIYLPYILFTVFSETFIDLADVSSNGTKMPRANWDFLQKVVLSIPPNELMEKFYKICMPIFIEIETLLNQIEILNQQKDSLLPRLISGKLSVENLDIQFPPSMQEL
ncbi:restriction endonuclease subunit S [uncultured Acinetobacter sp.]|uniref:restriction endonuclease subunit S n=1 Tax=uncultured Acinetobacter sp. TaxID=165433 RepID=UPI002589E107|nr:restriction endonuclease subunit S [uncultured Acinetobacter sp.]